MAPLPVPVPAPARRTRALRLLVTAAAGLALLALVVGAWGGVGAAGALDGPARPRPALVRADAALSPCPLPTSRAGLCGVVAGFAGWYGSWSTAGEAGAYCLEHGGSEPRPTLAYDRHPHSAGHARLLPEAAARLGYLLSAYGGTRDPVRAAALAVLAHAAVADTLTTDELGTYTTSLDRRVRALARDLWAEAVRLHGPYAVTLSFPSPGEALLRVTAASGTGLPGARVSWAGATAGAAEGRTGANGEARTRTAAGTPTAATVVADVGDLPADDVAVWVPHEQSVQTVAVGLPEHSAHVTSALPPPPVPPAPAVVTIVKTTDDPWVTPAGAVFRVVGADGTSSPPVTAGPDGRTAGVPVVAGRVTVVEDSPCPGCLGTPPIAADVGPGPSDVGVLDATRTHPLTIHKTAPDGSPLAGAVLRVRGAARPGAAYDIDHGTCSTGADGTCAVTAGGLPAGAYEVTEEQPAPATVRGDDPVREVQLAPEQEGVEVVFVDRRRTTAAFAKSLATGAVIDPAHVLLAGAVLVVSDPGAAPGTPGEVGRCTTTTEGRCTLPAGALVEDGAYVWSEVEAPPGLERSPGGHPFTARWCGDPCAPTPLAVTEPASWVRVGLVKSEAGTGAVVAGAVIDLCATGLAPALAATWSPPPGHACSSAESWLAAGTTDADGRADLGLAPPGVRVCAHERAAPPGWLLAAAPACAEGAPSSPREQPPGAGGPAVVTLQLPEQRVPPAVLVRVAAAATRRPAAPARAQSPAQRRPLRPPAGPPRTVAARLPSPPGQRTAPTVALPVTGAAVPPLLALAGLLLVAGICLLLVAPSRRPGLPAHGLAGPPSDRAPNPPCQGGWTPTMRP